MMNKMNKAAIHAMVAISAAKKQKGASSLEYIMLAAVIVGILLVVANADVGDKMKAFFEGIFTDAATVKGNPE